MKIACFQTGCPKWRVWAIVVASLALGFALRTEAQYGRQPGGMRDGGAGGGRAINQLDANNDGFLSYDEVSRERRGLTREMFDNMDRNNDGRLSVQEWRQGSASAQSGRNTGQADRQALRQPQAGAAQPRAARGSLFRDWDLNGDGRATQEEAMEHARREINLMDANRDGVVTEQEFLQRFPQAVSGSGGTSQPPAAVRTPPAKATAPPAKVVQTPTPQPTGIPHLGKANTQPSTP